MGKVKFTNGQVARGKAAVETENKSRIPFVANDHKPKVELRDYFLAAALQGLCANPNIIKIESEYTTNKSLAEIVRILAVEIADEVMLKGR